MWSVMWLEYMLWSANNYVVSAYVVSDVVNAYVVSDVVSAYVCQGCGQCMCLSGMWSVHVFVRDVVSAYVVSAYVCQGCGQSMCLSGMWSVHMWSVHMFVRDVVSAYVVRDAASANVISAYDVVRAYLCGQGCGQCIIINLVTCPLFEQMSSTLTRMMLSQKASATLLSPSCKIFNRRPGAPNPKVSRLDLPFTRWAVSFQFTK